jgi:hypothetical protein
MEDRYTNYDEQLKRLISERKKYGKLVIAFDFDNTIHDFHGVGDTYPKVIYNLLKAQRQGHILILFTANPNVEYCRNYCKEIGLDIEWINDSPIDIGIHKPYYNLLLDDRAGLGEAVWLLRDLLNTEV